MYATLKAHMYIYSPFSLVCEYFCFDLLIYLNLNLFQKGFEEAYKICRTM